MSQITQSRTRTAIGPLQIGIMILAAITACVHLYRGYLMSRFGIMNLPFPLLFFLNGIGYLALLAALYLPQFQRFQRPIRWTLMGYTALTIILWFAITAGRPNLLAYIDKPIEILLIVLLFIDDRQARKQL